MSIKDQLNVKILNHIQHQSSTVLVIGLMAVALIPYVIAQDMN